MSLVDQNNPYFFSEELGISPDSMPPVELFKQYYEDPETLNNEQKQELADFSFTLLSLAKYYDPNDEPGLEYIAKFMSYYCPGNSNYEQLNDAARTSVLAVFNSGMSCMKAALNKSSCINK
jgi:hypothetical protein